MRSLLVLAALLLLLPAGRPPAAAEEVPLAFLAAEPFAADLWPDRAPATAAPAGVGRPLVLRAARGQEVAALLVVRAARSLPRLEVRGGPLRNGSAEIAAGRLRLEVVRSVRRDIPGYSRLAGERYPDRYRDGILQPDVLVPDEPAFEKAVHSRGAALPDPSPGPAAVLGSLRAGSFGYLLLTVAVPADAAPGDYDGRIEAGGLGAPVRLTVDPFLLEPQRGKVLGIGNEFARDAEALFGPSLALLSRIGMNSTRIAEITSLPAPEAALALLGEKGFRHVIQIRPPRDAAEVRRVAEDLDLFFYGRDEPQPKDRERRDFRRMAEHVRLSARIHGMGGRVATSIPYVLALELRDPESPLYRRLASLGVEDLVEPLDWASYGLGLQRLSRPPRGRRVNRELLAYVARLQGEFDEAEWTEDGPALPSKHPWRETYYWPQGLIRCPFFGRLLFGFHLFRSHLDGALAWTLYRTRGLDPLRGGRDPIATLAYPARTTFYSTYGLEACREGVVDLRYAQQARRAVGRLLASENRELRRKGRKLRRVLLDLLEPYRTLVPGGKRIDLALPRPERALRETRNALADLILDAR